MFTRTHTQPQGNIHAREIVTPVLIVEAIKKLTSEYATNAAIKAIVDNNELYFFPTGIRICRLSK